MKPQIFLSLFIVAVSTCIYWKRDRDLQDLRAAQSILALKRAKHSEHTHDHSSHRRQHLSHQPLQIDTFAVDLTSNIQRYQKLAKNSSEFNHEVQRRTLRHLKTIESMSGEELQSLIQEILSKDDSSELFRQEICLSLIEVFGRKEPQWSLNYLVNSSKLFKQATLKREVVLTCLYHATKESPTDAAGLTQWLEKHEKGTDLVDQFVRQQFITILADAGHPQAFQNAFKYLKESHLPPNNPATFRAIFQKANREDERLIAINAFRAYLTENISNPVDQEKSYQQISAITPYVVHDGFAAGSRWFDRSKLSNQELDHLIQGLAQKDMNDETGKWIEWLGTGEMTEKRKNVIRKLTQDWTLKDYQATDQWLTSIPDSLHRNIAIQSHANTIAKVHPDKAAKWLKGLPRNIETPIEHASSVR